eukprot:scaffold3240_cov197-Alexandrium_tamarense.AAC.22
MSTTSLLLLPTILSTITVILQLIIFALWVDITIHHFRDLVSACQRVLNLYDNSGNTNVGGVARRLVLL